jgi:hypothetical protein
MMGKDNTDNSKNYELDRFKNAAEYIKHITTLSTGSIVIIVTFITKLTSGITLRLAVVIAVLGFVSSVVFATVLYSLAILYFHPGDEEAPSWLDSTMGRLMLLTVVAFLVGVISMACFAIANIS